MELAASPPQRSSNLHRLRFDWAIGAALAMLVWELLSGPSSFRHRFPLGTCLFVFLEVCALVSYDRKGSLQSVSLAALILATAALTTPPIAVSCAVFCLALYLARVRSHDTPLGFALLLFTPALLCAIGATAFALLNASPVFFYHVGEPWPAPVLGRADACFACIGAAAALLASRWRAIPG